MRHDDDYEDFVDRLFQKRRSGEDGLLHAAIGIAGEAGEILDCVKKSWVYGKEIDRAHLIEELGDLIHYYQMLCLVLNIDADVPVENNIAKLKRRYPNGYSDQAAIARADKIVNPPYLVKDIDDNMGDPGIPMGQPGSIDNPEGYR